MREAAKRLARQSLSPVCCQRPHGRSVLVQAVAGSHRAVPVPAAVSCVVDVRVVDVHVDLSDVVSFNKRRKVHAMVVEQPKQEGVHVLSVPVGDNNILRATRSGSQTRSAQQSGQLNRSTEAIMPAAACTATQGRRCTRSSEAGTGPSRVRVALLLPACGTFTACHMTVRCT